MTKIEFISNPKVSTEKSKLKLSYQEMLLHNEMISKFQIDAWLNTPGPLFHLLQATTPERKPKWYDSIVRRSRNAKLKATRIWDILTDSDGF